MNLIVFLHFIRYYHFINVIQYDNNVFKKLFSLAMKGNTQATTINAKAQKINNKVDFFFMLEFI